LREWAEKGVLGSWALQLEDNAADSTENWEIYEEEKSGEDLWLRACLGESSQRQNFSATFVNHHVK